MTKYNTWPSRFFKFKGWLEVTWVILPHPAKNIDDNIILLINGDDKPIIINSVSDDTIIELILPIKTY